MEDYYGYHHSWDGVAAYVRSLSPRNQAGGQPGQAQPGGQAPGFVPFVLVDQQGRVVLSGPGHVLGAQLPASAYAHGTPVSVDGQVVGTVLTDGSAPPLSPSDSRFLTSTERALILGGLTAILVALALGIVLARSLTRPVREITSALRAMAGGDLAQVVPVRSRDELGELSSAFNKMSADLALANNQRRQMTADIAHDLRTPVTVIGGYLEALRDGVLPPTPERFAILHAEAQHLQGLIEDLRTLSLADAGELALNPRPVASRGLLERITAAYQHQADQQSVALTVEAPDGAPPLVVDVARMVQVLSNLVGNALRYTPAGGAITLSAAALPDGTRLQVRDTGAGIAPETLPRIFDRFYRADAARSDGQGGSGLGLAIARALVEAHGGTITAQSEPGHGATFTIRLPS
ncbi:MAG: sensor histidine kinase [Ktedonobacterales bacterium]